MLNAVFRVAYPLVPFVALRYGVSIEAATLIVTVQVLAGLASPIGGWLGDHVGYRNAMAFGLVITICGTLIIAAAPSLVWVLVGCHHRWHRHSHVPTLDSGVCQRGNPICTTRSCAWHDRTVLVARWHPDRSAPAMAGDMERWATRPLSHPRRVTGSGA